MCFFTPLPGIGRRVHLDWAQEIPWFCFGKENSLCQNVILEKKAWVMTLAQWCHKHVIMTQCMLKRSYVSQCNYSVILPTKMSFVSLWTQLLRFSHHVELRIHSDSKVYVACHQCWKNKPLQVILGPLLICKLICYDLLMFCMYCSINHCNNTGVMKSECQEYVN